MNKQDLRSIKTERALQQSLLALLQQAAFAKITTKAIYQRALIGKSTFYQHYVDKYDLLSQMVTEETQHFADLLTERMKSWQYDEVLLNLYGDLEQRKSTFLALYHLDVAGLSLQRNLLKLLEQHAEPLLKHYQFPVPKAFIVKIYASVALDAIIWSLEQGDGQQIAPFTNQIIKDIIEHYN